MKHFTFDNHWDEIKGKLKQRYGQLTDDDFAFVEGKGEELLGRLRERLGISSDALNTLLDEFYSEAGSRVEWARHKASELAEDVRARAATAAEDVKAQAGVAYDQARRQARGFWEEGEEYVRQNPRESLVTALFAGFIAGLLIRR